ncbi:MAG TPA: endonuclease III [Ktedonobacterales bacterium]
MSESTGESTETRSARARAIVSRLRDEYPDARCSLNFTNPLELLVATVLSAQCTDERVNQVTVALFQKYRTAEDYAQANPEQLEQDVKQTGFYRNKAKHIREAAARIVERHGGEVPRAMEDLTALPGVARKTANVVQGNAFGIVEGVVVDTHVGRLARRMGLTDSEDPAKVEQELMALLPQADWLDLSHLFIFHGRAICQARKPTCEQCVVAEMCPTGRATLGMAGVAAPVRPAREKAPARVRSTRGGRA